MLSPKSSSLSHNPDWDLYDYETLGVLVAFCIQANFETMRRNKLNDDINIEGNRFQTLE